MRGKGKTRKIGIDRGLRGGTVGCEQFFTLKIGSETKKKNDNEEMLKYVDSGFTY